MKLHKIVYEMFYNELLDFYRDHVLEYSEWNKNGKVLKRKSKQWWDVTRTVDNETFYVSLQISGEVSSDAGIYYRILTDYNSPKKTIEGYQDISDEILAIGLKFIGVVIPEKVALNWNDPHITEGQILLQTYLELKKPSILVNFLELKIYDSVTSKFIKPAVKESKYISLDNDIDLKSNLNTKYLYKKPTQQHEQDVLSLANKYFLSLKDIQFSTAMSLWHPDLQKRKWNNSVESFEDEFYHRTVPVDFHIWKVSISNIELDYFAVCYVVFEKFISIRLNSFSQSIINILNFRFKDLSQFVDKAAYIYQNSGNGTLENKPVKTLFTSDFISENRAKIYSYSKLENNISTVSKRVVQLLMVNFEFDQNEWHITNISDIPTNELLEKHA